MADQATAHTTADIAAILDFQRVVAVLDAIPLTTPLTTFDLKMVGCCEKAVK